MNNPKEPTLIDAIVQLGNEYITNLLRSSKITKDEFSLIHTAYKDKLPELATQLVSQYPHMVPVEAIQRMIAECVTDTVINLREQDLVMTSKTCYIVGQVIPVINFKAQYKNGNIVEDCVRPLPWDDRIIDINIHQLKCVEHHKVAWRHDGDGEKKYDGFVLKDECGNIVHNQYPYVDYGQVDDSADRIFTLVLKDDTDKITDIVHFVDMFSFLGNILHGIYQLEQIVSELPDDIPKLHYDFSNLKTLYSKKNEKIKIDMLHKLYNDVVLKYEAQSLKKIKTKPVVITFTDPEKLPAELEGFWKVYSE